jgi:hypothetical protein
MIGGVAARGRRAMAPPAARNGKRIGNIDGKRLFAMRKSRK